MIDKKRDIDELADEYVLGLLDAADHDEVEARLEHDRQLRMAVGASRDRFIELDLVTEPIDHSPGLWDRISSGIAGDLQRGGGVPGTTPPVSGSARAPANDNSRLVWRAAALASMAASLLLAIMLSWSLVTAPQPTVIAILVDNAGEALAVVEDYGNTTARVTPLVDFDVPDGRVMQVWTLPNQDLGAVSLGLLERKRTALLDGPSLPEPHAGQLYEITLEQAGGSPTGRPTGPILVKGFAKLPR